jgi:hypothetical protein
MSTDMQTNWPWIVKLFEQGLVKTGFYAFATVGPDGSPHMAPYGSLVLNDNCSGYYCDVFPNQMAQNLIENQNICVMATNFGMWYWLKGLFLGRFDHWPGIRLYGTAGKIRRAEPGEVEKFRVRVKHFKLLKGYNLLWKNIHNVRDIHFTHFQPIRLGTMTRHLPHK